MTLAQRTFAEVEIARARRDDPETSKTAAAHSHGLASEHRLQILRAMRDGGDRDWTAHELAAACELSAVQVCRRLDELRRDAEIEVVVGKTRPTPSDRPARCFRRIRP
jgi:response regulator of citrate/malate metabolism